MRLYIRIRHNDTLQIIKFYSLQTSPETLLEQSSIRWKVMKPKLVHEQRRVLFYSVNMDNGGASLEAQGLSNNCVLDFFASYHL